MIIVLGLLYLFFCWAMAESPDFRDQVQEWGSRILAAYFVLMAALGLWNLLQ